ncbi:MAG: glycosyl hydrolase-related protein [Thermoproteota archaeon]
MTGGVFIRRIEQTCFFIQEDVLKNLIKIHIFNDEDSSDADLLVRLGSNIYKIALGPLKKGEGIYDVYIQDARENTEAEFSICDPLGNILASSKINWEPKKHWVIHLVQYSHHDLGYTDIPQNVLDEYIKFYDLIMKYCEETEDWPDEVKFRYHVEQLWSILHYLQTQPRDRVEKLLKLVRNGRIGISALLGNEVTGLLGHEEIIRLLYPAFMLKRTYGVSAEVAELNDVPGLSWGLATSLSGSGVKVIAPLLPRWYYGKHTPFWDEEKVTGGREPTAFWWESLSGGRVLFWYQNIEFGVNTGFNESYGKALEELPKLLKTLEEKNYPFSILLIRLTTGARDNSPPSLKQCVIAREWNSRWVYPKIVISTLDQFFKHLRKDYWAVLDRLPVFKGEIPDSDYPVGATSTMQATIVNRNAHDLIPAAEKIATIADQMFGLPYPWKEHVEKAYQHNLLYDEHTWGLMCPFGPAQETSRVEKTLHAYKAYCLAHDVLVKSLNRIVDEITLEEKGCYIIVFNSLPWVRTDIVRVQLLEPDPCGHPMFEAEVAGDKHVTVLLSSPVLGRNVYHPPVELFKKPFKLLDAETGETINYQRAVVTSSETPVQYAADKASVGKYEERFAWEIVFVAKDVPPLGYKVYKIVEEENADTPLQGEADEEYVIENEFYRIEVEPDSGIVKRICDKELKRELVDPDASHGFGQIIVRESATFMRHPVEDIRVEKGFNGPVIKSIIIKGSARGFPLIVEEIVLYKGVKKIDLNIRISKDSTPLNEMYVSFPFKADNPRFTYEGPNIVVTPIEDQFPGSHTCYYPVQHWVNVCDENEDFGVTWSSIDAHLVMFGGLYPLGVSFAHHGVTPPGYPSEELRVRKFEKGHIYSFVLENNFRTNFYATQTGDLLLRYSLTSHKGGWREGTAMTHGWNSTNPLTPVFAEGGRKGVLSSKSSSFLRINPSNIIVTTMKTSEDGEGFVLRLLETLGKETKTSINLPFPTVEEACLTNIVEEEIKHLEVSGKTITLTLKPFEVATVKIKTRKPGYT